MIVAVVLGVPAVARAGDLGDLRSEVRGGSSSASDSSDDDDDDEGDIEDDGGSDVGAAVGATIVGMAQAASAQFGPPGFSRYPYEIRRGGWHRGWAIRPGRGPKPGRMRRWSMRVAGEGAFLGGGLWRAALDAEVAWWRLSLRSDLGFYIEQPERDALYLGTTAAYLALVMQPRLVWRVGGGPQYMIDAVPVGDPRREDAVGGVASTTIDGFPVRPIVVSGRLDAGKLGAATTLTVRGTVGLLVRRFEVFGGYERRAIGRLVLHGPVFGARVWF